jgi:DNA-binding CsgD family transcriptional regulator
VKHTEPLHSVWARKGDQIAIRVVDLDRNRLDELIASIFSNGPFYFYVVDFSDNMKINYMSPSVREIHGLDPETTTFQDILNQIHPDDMPFVAKAEDVAWRFADKVMPREFRDKYKKSYCFRFRTADGSYQLFNHQAVVLSLDENGGLSKSLNIHTNISHLTKENNHKLSLIGMFNAPSFLNIDVWSNELSEPVESLFTVREAEIIRLISDGLNSNQIADRLFITTDTVKTHRKNIMKKSGCRNVGQLITRCITHGLL